MRKKRVTDVYAHDIVISIPNAITVIAIMNMLVGGNMVITAGSSCIIKYNVIPNKISAAIPEKRPIYMFCIINGRRMNPHVAPTSFMVCNKNLLEYIDNLTAFPISDHDISVKTAVNVNSIMAIFRILSFIVSIISL